MAKKPKQVPGSAAARADVKQPRIAAAAVSTYPSWRFCKVDHGGPFAWPKNRVEELEIVQKLHSFDSMEWRAIEGSDHHAIEVARLSRPATKRLEEIGQDDLDEVFSFHFTGKKRIIGIRESGTVRLLWWDPEHAVCPSKLKNT